MILLGLFLTVFSIVKDAWILIYGVPVFIIGIFIFLNKKEDSIEGIKSREELKNK